MYIRIFVTDAVTFCEINVFMDFSILACLVGNFGEFIIKSIWCHVYL